MQEEIFGPVLVSLTFRTPAEAIALANNTRYGLAASIWSENINLALDVASKVKAGSVWVNCTNLFDAASGFGGYRESGFGREGGREGLFEYLRPGLAGAAAPGLDPGGHRSERRRRGPRRPTARCCPDGKASANNEPQVDRTPKMYIGGKQARPDGNYTRGCVGAEGRAGRAGRRRQPQRYPQRRGSGARGHLAKSGWAHAPRLQPCADSLLHRRKPGARG